MSILAEAMIAAFDSNTELVWSLESTDRAIAKFSVAGSHVEITFLSTGSGHWRVAFKVDSNTSLAEGMNSSIRIFSGVFQAVKEFLEIRQPERLVFASKEEALGHLYETYLARQGTELSRLGYKTDTTKLSPLAEFSISKETPSEWKN